MAKLTKLAISILFTLLLCTAAYATPLQITVSIAPQEYFVKKIGGDLVDVNVMVRPGSSPATYEPQPKQMAQLSKADLYYSIGVPFENAWLPRFKSANQELTIVKLEDSVARIPMQDHLHTTMTEQDNSPHVDHGANFIADPHIWLAPSLSG